MEFSPWPGLLSLMSLGAVTGTIDMGCWMERRDIHPFQNPIRDFSTPALVWQVGNQISRGPWISPYATINGQGNLTGGNC